jgi:Tfp pilus assembly protein FimT
MKIQRQIFPRKNERGMATLVFIALLAIMLLLVAANGKSLFQLHREIKLLEQQQIKQLNAAQTNSVVLTNLESK